MPFAYYARLTRSQQAIYRKSDTIAEIRLEQPAALHPLVAALQDALKSEDRAATQRATAALIGALNDAMGLPPVKAEVLAARPHAGGDELHGRYTNERGKPITIQLWMRTAKQKRVVAFRTYLRTLLHEVGHHVDYTGLRLADSFHTEGFYKRESSLFYQLVPERSASRLTMQSVFEQATSGLSQAPKNWMPATGTRAFVFDDPILIWLNFYGAAHGFQKDTSPYEFTEFIFEKGRQFEQKWISEIAPMAVRVCSQAYEVRDVEKFRQTLDLITRGVPIIASPALWWAPERVFGVPDLLVNTAWLRKRFPAIQLQPASPEYYTVFDMKFTTKLDSSKKKLSLQNFAAQVRIYSYIVGQITGAMAPCAWLVCRDRIDNPLDVSIHSAVGAPLDEDLREIRDRYLDIKLNGANYRPGIDPEIEANLGNDQDDPWHTAKLEIARDRVPGGDPCLVYEIGRTQRQTLANRRFPSLQSLLGTDPGQVPLESCKGLGAAKCPRIRAVLRSNRAGTVTPARLSCVPTVKPLEFYVDFETFNNLNVDFDKEWPTLVGREMVFMIGVGWVQDDKWEYRAFVADAESRESERQLLQDFEEFLGTRAGNHLTDDSSTALFHWTNAEVWQLRRACNRHALDPAHTLRTLPWYDLQKEVFLAEPVGIPGALGYGLKEVASALGLARWPGNLDDGLRASVAGWKAYQANRPIESADMKIVKGYNEVDCKALFELVRWVRRPTSA